MARAVRVPVPDAGGAHAKLALDLTAADLCASVLPPPLQAFSCCVAALDTVSEPAMLEAEENAAVPRRTPTWKPRKFAPDSVSV